MVVGVVSAGADSVGIVSAGVVVTSLFPGVKVTSTGTLGKREERSASSAACCFSSSVNSLLIGPILGCRTTHCMLLAAAR